MMPDGPLPQAEFVEMMHRAVASLVFYRRDLLAQCDARHLFSDEDATEEEKFLAMIDILFTQAMMLASLLFTRYGEPPSLVRYANGSDHERPTA